LLFLFTLWYWASWIFRRDMPRSRWFLRVASITGVLAVVTMEAGWIVSEVGRQPWIVYNMMRVSDAATTNVGVWITFIVVALLYAGLGITTILVLRGMSRRARREPRFEETDVPYGPSETADRPQVRAG
jgi:cytochrome d ubiquinol oxidase subunit I